MEEKLERYRANVRRREKFERIKQRLIKMVTFTSSQNDQKKNEESIEISEVNEQVCQIAICNKFKCFHSYSFG